MEHKLAALRLSTTLGEDVGNFDAAESSSPSRLAYNNYKMTVLLDDRPMAADKELVWCRRSAI